MVRDMYDYCFNQLKVQRVTARTHPAKRKVIDVMVRMGFRVEGRVRRYYPDGSDAVLFGMLSHEFALLPVAPSPSTDVRPEG